MNSLIRIVFAAIAGFAAFGQAAYAAAVEADAAVRRESHIVRFEEPGLLHYDGGIDGLPATAPAARGARKLDVGSDEAQRYRAYLHARRSEHVAAMAQALGRDLTIRHSYSVTQNGVAVELTAAEAGRVSALPGVASVRRVGFERLHTYRGPTFIGAEAIWSGEATPAQLGTKGQGVVIGVIDSGAHSSHPAFANIASCGHDAQRPKLLGAVDCSLSDGGLCIGPNPEANSGNGHGVHVAGTAAGNVLDAAADPAPPVPPPYTEISGVAPCAHVRSYKVCETNMCEGTAIQAAIENAIADGVDVINYSIGGGIDPWNDLDRGFLDAVGAGIFVAASAGNTGAVTDPTGQVNHLSPWTMTVAASTHDRNPVGMGALSVTGPGTPPATTQNLSLRPGSGIDAGLPLTGVPLRYRADNVYGCTAFPAGYFAGAVALIARGGDCTFESKINHAQAAGAVLVVVFNTDDNELLMIVGAATLPAYGIPFSHGQMLISFIDAAEPEPVTVDFTPAWFQGDTLADFSLRGPTGGVYRNLTKPDVTAPGVNILAAMDAVGGEYTYMSGTSMASPHVAGAAALVRAVHPDWTPMEVKSALQTTAVADGYKDNAITPWDADDVGSGRVDLRRAALAGLVLDESYADFVAANPAGGALAITELNLPSLRNVACSPSCTFTRTVTNRLATAGTWQVSYQDISGNLLASVEPDSLTLAPGESQTLSITLAPPYGVVMNRIGFGRLWFTESENRSPAQQFSVAIKGVGSFSYVDVQAVSATVTDQCHADPNAGNGVIEPGETIRLTVPLRARGADFTDVRVSLVRPAPAGVTYLSGTSVVGSIPLGASTQADFTLQLDAGHMCLSELTLPIEVVSDQGVYRTTFTADVGTDRFEPLDVPKAIPDAEPAGTVSVLSVPQDVTIASLEVRVALEHEWIGDVTLKLTSPSGTEVVLLDRPGHPAAGAYGCDNRDAGILFSDAAAVDSEAVCEADPGAFWPATTARPAEPLAALAGESAQGTWTLTATDNVNGYYGRIMSWSLQPDPPFATVCAVCGDAPERIFADDFDGDER